MSIPEVLKSHAKQIIILALFSFITACGGGAEEALNNLNQFLNNLNNSVNDSQVALNGSVGDGPITGATITIKAADGTELATTVSDINAGYEVSVSDQAAYPYLITATSGTDMVTGMAPDFTMVSVAMGPDDTTVNINPFTTLIVKTAQTMPGGLTAANLEMANQTILQRLNFGLDITTIPHPISTPITNENVANIVKASEVLAEMIRRTHTALLAAGQSTSADQIISSVAADMTDGIMDGIRDANGTGTATPLIAATANIVSGQVLVEALSNNLYVNGVWATDLLDNAIRATLPGSTATTADVTITEAMIDQTKTALAAAQVNSPDASLIALAKTIDSITLGSSTTDIETVLPIDSSTVLNSAIVDMTQLTDNQLDDINTVVREADTAAVPIISLTASPVEVAMNGNSTLTWMSNNAISCSAVGNWITTHATSGSVTVGPLIADTTYTLNCINANSQITSQSVSITVSDTSKNTSNDISYNLFLSVSPDRTDPVPLAGATVSGNIYIYAGPATNVTRTRFFLDDASLNGTPITIESFAPFDFMTTATGGTGTPFDTTSLTDGQHNVTVSIDLSDGTNKVISANFNVANSGEIVQNTLALTWSPNTDNISGYIVYYGSTADTATTQVSDIPVNMTGFDPQNPSIKYKSWDDLGLLSGYNVCFTLKAYNADGLSEGTPALCSVI